MSIPNELDKMQQDFWREHNKEFDMSLNEGCGAYIEAFVRHAQSHGFPKVGHLKKSGGTKYNGHANDGFLYKEAASDTNPLLQFVDIIGNATAKPPYTPSNQPPKPLFDIDEPRYTEADWLAAPGSDNPTSNKTVPWVAYDENGFEKLKKMLEHDYTRRPQNADFDVSVWAARVFHSTYMGPGGTPLGMDAALRKHKPELCSALKIPIDDYYGD